MLSKDELEIPTKSPSPIVEPPTTRKALSPANLGLWPTTTSPELALEAGMLIIGRQTSFHGGISACRRLVVEGSAEAKLEKCQHIDVAEAGFLKGQVSTESMEVSGRFEGDLVVRKLLLIRAKGHVAGTITYGEIEIERGGRVVGVTEARESAGQKAGW